jgi:hypothetical protein
MITPSYCPLWPHDNPGQTAGSQNDWPVQSYTTTWDMILRAEGLRSLTKEFAEAAGTREAAA